MGRGYQNKNFKIYEVLLWFFLLKVELSITVWITEQYIMMSVNGGWMGVGDARQHEENHGEANGKLTVMQD